MAYGGFILLRGVKTGFDPTAFICAGDVFVDPNHAPGWLSVARDSGGYDGQFFYRLALDPFSSKVVDYGVRLDNPPYRQQRLLYPLIAWSITGGYAPALPYALILTNYAALVLIGWLAAHFAQRVGAHAAWGLLLAFYPGFILSLARDTAEIVQAACLLAGLLWLQQARYVPAALALAAAVLAKETAVGVGAGIGLTALGCQLGPRRIGASRIRLPHAIQRMRVPHPYQTWQTQTSDSAPSHSRIRPAAIWLPATLPIVTYIAWQLLLGWRWGTLPLLAGSGNLGWPGAGLLGFIADAATRGDHYAELWRGQLLALAMFAFAVVWCWRSSATAPSIRLSWLLYLILALMLSRMVWVEDWAFLRALTEFYLLGTLIIIGTRGKVALLATGVMLINWLAVAHAKRGA